jgi:glycosyltransferase involved in cell wall biosynthesis
MTAIVISYRIGDTKMLQICLKAIKRHTLADYEIILAVDGSLEDFDAFHISKEFDKINFYDIEEELEGSQRHSELLDLCVAELISCSKYAHLLTLDCDCFPINDGWLQALLDMNADVAGIRHPWLPYEGENRKTFEFKLRRGWNWDNTHVACQLTKMDFVREHNLGYLDKDDIGYLDTGLIIPLTAHRKGLKVDGFMPTRCPMPDNKEFDPEFNREVCVVFGDMIYHHGGSSRENESIVWPARYFQKSRERVVSEKDARWLLDEGYEYAMDKEEDVVEAKMRVMHSLMVQYLMDGNESLF